jgi:hypothetical protein
MAITGTDIELRGSVLTGSAGDSTAQTTQSQWLGKNVSTTVVGTGANAVYDDVNGAENTALESEYRCVFVLNKHATLAWLNPVVYLSAEVAGGTNISIATDNIAASAKGSASAQAAQVANEDTAPTGVSAFSSPTTAATGLSLGASLPAGFVKAVWIKRTTTNSAAVDADGVTLGFSGDTAA